MDFNFCKGTINKSYRGFVYRLDRTLKSGIQSFRCVIRDCKGRIHVDGDVTTVREQPRTNNSVEAWHRAFQRTVGYVHPTVYKLIEALRLEQSNTENSVVRLQAGQRAPLLHVDKRNCDFKQSFEVSQRSDLLITCAQ